MMGADYFESKREFDLPKSISELPEIGVGNNSMIKNTIIDKNARIGSDVFLSPDGLQEGWADDLKGVYARDGILVVVKNGVVPSGTKIGN